MSFSAPNEPSLNMQTIGYVAPIHYEQPSARPPVERIDAASTYLAGVAEAEESTDQNATGNSYVLVEPPKQGYGEPPYGPSPATEE